MYLVIGATGKTGGAAAHLLVAAGARVRAFVRDRMRASGLEAAGVELAVGDLDRPETLTPALRDVQGLLLVSSPDRRMAELQTGAITAARNAGVRLVVKISALGAQPSAKVRVVRQHGEIEQALKGSGGAWTILQPNFFFDNFLNHAASIAAEGAFYSPAAGAGGAAAVDARDIAAVAVAALTSPGHEGKTYVVTGPAALSHDEAARILSEGIGREVRYVQVTPERARAAMLADGIPEWYADDLLKLQEIYGKGVAATVTDVVERATGRRPRSFADFVRDNLSHFQTGKPAPRTREAGSR